ncbi:MAG TPA: hypothetical protein VFH70_10275 [Acidimicrobiales bacterium]|nr:hypothetical protein [Acidimicrobiales bacterium]
MFTPIDHLPTDQQIAVLHALDAPAEWELTWDIGLTDAEDAYSIAPLWGRGPVDGRWPAAFPINRSNGIRPWRMDNRVHYGHRCPLVLSNRTL